MNAIDESINRIDPATGMDPQKSASKNAIPAADSDKARSPGQGDDRANTPTGNADSAAEQDQHSTQDDSPEAIRADITAVRAELGDTVEALAAKADVKAHVKDAARHARDASASGVGMLRERLGPIAVGVTALAAAATLLIWMRRSQR